MQEKALHCDTDSVIYIQPKDVPQLVETGDNLGDMTSKLKPYETITEFMCGGKELCVYGNRH